MRELIKALSSFDPASIIAAWPADWIKIVVCPQNVIWLSEDASEITEPASLSADVSSSVETWVAEESISFVAAGDVVEMTFAPTSVGRRYAAFKEGDFR